MNANFNPGAALAALRPKVPHICPVCGAAFTAIRTAVYCSNRCRQAAKYKKRAAVIRETLE